jgi:hypothetical protein
MFMEVMNVCANVVALEECMCVHQQTIWNGLKLNVFVQNSFVDMHAKCGNMENAWNVLFTKCHLKNLKP